MEKNKARGLQMWGAIPGLQQKSILMAELDLLRVKRRTRILLLTDCLRKKIIWWFLHR